MAGASFGPALVGAEQGTGVLSPVPEGPDTIGDRDRPATSSSSGLMPPGPGGAHDRLEAPRGSGRRLPVQIAAVAGAALVLVGGGAAAGFAMTGGGDTATVKPTPLADAPREPDPTVLAAQREQVNQDMAANAARNDAGKRMKMEAKGRTPTPKPSSSSGGGGGGGYEGNPVPAGEAQRIAKAMLPDYGFDPDTQFGCLVKLWNKESGWRVNADNPSSEAYGIPQANPGSKMATEGADWRTNPRTQIKWGLKYIKGRHGTPCGAWAHSESNGWY